jgi:antitoxin CptB
LENTIPPKLRWSCRRGMLELDVLLGHFLEEAYTTLSVEDQAIFTQLLACQDQDLFMWLTGKEVSSDKNLQYIIEKIRAHAEHRHHS